LGWDGFILGLGLGSLARIILGFLGLGLFCWGVLGAILIYGRGYVVAHLYRVGHVDELYSKWGSKVNGAILLRSSICGL
jgi:hypothetical protein